MTPQSHTRKLKPASADWTRSAIAKQRSVSRRSARRVKTAIRETVKT